MELPMTVFFVLTALYASIFLSLKARTKWVSDPGWTLTPAAVRRT